MNALHSPFRSPAIRMVELELAASAVTEQSHQMRCPQDAARLFFELVGRADREHFVVLYVNARHQVTHAHVVSRGCTRSAPVHPREVFKGAFLANASAIIVGHNHPSGDVTPSDDDERVVERLRVGAELLGIELLDALIVVASGKYH